MSIIFYPYLRVLCGVAFICLFNLTAVVAQPFGIKKYTINDGLPDAYILCVYQDSNGFLWIGTANGLSRFDGREFVNYNFADGLPDDYVNKILEDSHHRLWVGTQRGIAQMKGEKLVRYTTSDSLEIGFVFDIREMASGQIWGLTDRGIYVFNKDRWNKLRLYPGLENTHCRNLVEFNGRMIINYGDYLVQKNENGKYTLLDKQTKDWPFFNVVSQFKERYYLSSRQGLFRIDGSHHIPMFSSFLERKRVQHYFTDSRDRTWLSIFSDGLYVSYPNDISKIEQRIPVGSNLVSQVFEDRSGIIWIAAGDGLYRAEPRSYEMIDGFKTGRVRLLRNLIVDPLGNTLICSEGDGMLKVHEDSLQNFPYRATPEVKSAFDHAIIDGYCTGGDKAIWMVSRRGNLFTLNNNEMIERKFGAMGNHGGLNDIDYNKGTASYYVSSDTLYEGDGNRFFPFLSSDAGKPIVFPLKIGAFDNGLTLVGTRNGPIWMIDQQKKVHPYSNILNIPMVTNRVNFYKENKERFWVSFSGGLKRYRWNEQNLPVEELLINEDNGLSNNAVYSMAFDSAGRIWAVTAAGIITIHFYGNGSRFYIKKWNETDGIVPENLQVANLVQDEKGNMCIQLSDRLYVFHPNKINWQIEPPEVVITNIQLKLQETNWQKYTDSLLGYMQLPFQPVLPSDMNSLGIFYKGISFGDYSGLEYSYRLNGDSSSWSPSQKNGFVSFVGLPPGSYHFMVRVRDSNRKWSRPAEFSFVVLKPFWQRWWFILLLILLFGYVLFSLFQFRLHEKLMVLNIRQKLHRDLHDDIGATLSSIKVYSEVLQDDPGNSIIIGLIRENAEDMIGQLELIAWATNPKNDSFKSLCDLMKKFAIPACFAKKIELEFISDSIQPQLIIPGNIRKNLFLAYKEAVNNVIKYSEATSCHTSMEIRDRKFILQIADNGIGMRNDGRENGYGIQNMRKRAEELKGSLEISSEAGRGVNIIIMVPFPFKIPYSWDERGKEYL